LNLWANDTARQAQTPLARGRSRFEGAQPPFLVLAAKCLFWARSRCCDGCQVSLQNAMIERTPRLWPVPLSRFHRRARRHARCGHRRRGGVGWRGLSQSFFDPSHAEQAQRRSRIFRSGRSRNSKNQPKQIEKSGVSARRHVRRKCPISGAFQRWNCATRYPYLEGICRGIC
jgi:hypothetical protein